MNMMINMDLRNLSDGRGSPKDFPSRVDANDECFLSPESMIEEVKRFTAEEPDRRFGNFREIATVIYTSLAECYAKTAKELEEMTGRTFSLCIHVVGGGSNAGYLMGAD